MASQKSPTGRVLRDVHHGSHVLPDDAPAADQLIEAGAAVRQSAAVPDAPPVPDTTKFDYMFDTLATEYPDHHLPIGNPDTVTAALKKLGAALTEPASPPDDGLQHGGDSTIPAIYTYWGQFIDHDMTANTDRKNTVTDVTVEHLVPLQPSVVRRDLKNLREPSLNLDSIYGDGPTFPGEPETLAASQYDGIALRVGQVAQANDDGGEINPDHVHIPTLGDEAHDLPRAQQGDTTREKAQPLIGDGRNDENLIVAQFHVAMLRFHNSVLAWSREQYPYEDDRAQFIRVRNLVRWHYQWLVVHDYLKAVTLPGIVDKVLLGGNKYVTKRDNEVYMPLEFSVAAYRFGHTMVRGAYDFNRNFPRASFGLIFAFTGGARARDGQPNPFFGNTTVLPFNWVIEWDRFVDKGDSDARHFARKIDSLLTPPLFSMTNQTAPERPTPPMTPAELAELNRINAILQSLAVRNLLRGYQLALPTGQAVAKALKASPLTEEELTRGNSASVNEALTEGGFLAATPLWYYILKEAEVRANGNHLGEVGSRIVVETIIGQLRNDPESYLNTDGGGGGWNPEQGAMPHGEPHGEPIVTIKDLLKYAGVLPGPTA